MADVFPSRNRKILLKKKHKTLLQMNVKVKEYSKQAKEIFFIDIIFSFISNHFNIASAYL